MAYGMRPVTHGGYNYNTGGFEEFPIKSAYSTRISNGDFVKLVANHGVEYLATAPTPLIGTVGAGTSGAQPANPALGIFVGCRYVDGNGTPTWSQYYPGAGTETEIQAFVVTDANAVFTIQGTGVWTETYLGTVLIPTIAAGTGSIGNSGNVLPDYAADPDGTLRIVGVVRDGENESTNTTPDILVRWSSPSCLLYGYQTAI